MINFGLNSASFLAQVNVGATPATFLGIFLAVAGAALYFLRSVRPELSRDQDIFFAAVGLLCGFILIFQGWRLDPILQFGQLLLVGTTVFFAVESIRLRGIATEQAKRNTKIVDDGRDVSENYSYNRRYKAEVDAELEPLPYDDYETERPRARIRGSRDDRSRGDDYYTDEAPRRSERRNTREKPETTDKPRRPSSRRPVNPTPEITEDDEWGSSSRQKVDDWDNSGEVRKPARRGGNGNSRPESTEEQTPRARRRRASGGGASPYGDATRTLTPNDSPVRREREDDATPTEYVDYKPLEQPDESDNSTKFDDI
ncbi:MAG: Ycf66 family protein [Hassallia sp.]